MQKRFEVKVKTAAANLKVAVPRGKLRPSRGIDGKILKIRSVADLAYLA